MNKFVPNKTKFVNTNLFCEAAQHYLRHGCYTFAPYGTVSYREYWDEEEKRCLDGYTVGGVTVTGEHYAYMNYCQIKITVKVGKLDKKKLGFPRFLDMDYYYYHEMLQARLHGEGMIVAKSRRKGFSYKGAFNVVYRYNWHRESFNIIGAFMGDYAQATMAMGLEMVNFINTNTDWAKRKLIDTQKHIKNGFKEKVNGIETEQGFKSEIMTLSFKDNPFKSIGKTADIFLFEEAGKWPKLIEAYTLSEPLFRDGEVVIGMPIIYGTGGDMEGGTQDFAEMFYNPTGFRLRAYENIYDENATGDCGWFVSDHWFKLPYVDVDGNSKLEEAARALEAERELKKTSVSKRAYEKYITQYPKTPAEAFLQTSGNVFPTVMLNEQLNWLRASNRAKNKRHVGKLVSDHEGKISFELDKDLEPVEVYPLDNDADTRGALVIYHNGFPEDNPPYGKYVAGCDTYDQDKSQTGSLGSIFIYRRMDPNDILEGKTNQIVAEYTGRPNTAEEFYEIARKMLLFYNATCLYENQLKGMHFYFDKHNCSYLLAESPDYFVRDVIKDSKVERGKGLHMTKGIKDAAEILARDWLMTEEQDIPNLYRLYSIPLIQELIAYNDTGNFDRAIAFMLVILYDANLHRVQIKKREEEEVSDNFFTRKLFKR
jgi:hypothetical protein